MRQELDALRSVVRHADLVLNEGPAPLAEVWWEAGGDYSAATYRWTHAGASPGAAETDELVWAQITRAILGPPVAVAAAGRRWQRRQLVFPPLPAWVTAAAGPVAPAPSKLPQNAKNPWEVRLAAERGELTFPMCRVNQTAQVVYTGGPPYTSAAMALSLECYPEERAETADEAVLAAARVAGVLTRGFWTEGLVEPGLGTPAWPRRVPLFDYELVTLDQGRSQARLAPDFLAVQDWSTRQLADLDDQRRVALIAELRVGWRISMPPRRGTVLADSLALDGVYS